MKFLLTLSAAGVLLSTSPFVQASDEPCAELASRVEQAYNDKDWSIPADVGLACLQSVPIVKSEAAEFVRFFNSSILQFQSTASYLKNPPSTYQQPPVDLQAGISEILDNVDSDHYENQYDFEADIQKLLQATHDGHLFLEAGALSALYFKGPYELVSVSKDGQDLPAVYARADLVRTIAGLAPDWEASSLKTINGQDASEYLRQLAASQSVGGLEPHADWNDLMANAAHAIQGQASGFQSLDLFPDTWFNATFENGTASIDQYQVMPKQGALQDLIRISSGQDFYQKFVRLPRNNGNLAGRATSGRPTRIVIRDGSTSPITEWGSPYPSPAVAEKNLRAKGWVTGYFQDDISLGVLSIPTFESELKSLRTTVEKFLNQAKQAGIQHILIDVQANPGGSVHLAAELFKHFFPTQDPYLGSQLRLTAGSNYLGAFYSQQAAKNQSEGPNEGITPWVAQSVVDPTTNLPYRTWASLADGPTYGAGKSTKSALQDYKNDPEFADVYGYNGQPINKTQPYDARDIAILTDGHCASTCTLLVELMQHQSGVRVVAAGGLPQDGPMQGAAGVRGAQSYSLKEIKSDIMFVRNSTSWDDLAATAQLDYAVAGDGLRVLGGGFNLRNLVRKGKEIPQQFAYEPADCRIYYTPQTFNNYTALWTRAAAALWEDSSLCVANSTTALMAKYRSGT